MAKKKKKATRRRAKTARTVARRTPADSFDFDSLVHDKEAEPAQPTKRMLDEALRKTLKGAPTVVIKGKTRHQIQTQLVPLFTKMAEAAGLAVEDQGLGKLKAGRTTVIFEPFVTVVKE